MSGVGATGPEGYPVMGSGLRPPPWFDFGSPTSRAEWIEETGDYSYASARHLSFEETHV